MRLRQQAAACLQMTANYSSSAEARPLAWVFLGPPVRMQVGQIVLEYRLLQQFLVHFGIHILVFVDCCLTIFVTSRQFYRVLAREPTPQESLIL